MILLERSIYMWLHSRRQRTFRASIPVQLKQGISIDRLLHTAIYRNYPDAVKDLLDLGANVDDLQGEGPMSMDHRLEWAAQEDKISEVLALLREQRRMATGFGCDWS